MTTKRRFPTHPDELRSLLAGCHEAPDDDAPRLVLADWLEERDDPRGTFMRLQCQLEAMPAMERRIVHLALAEHDAVRTQSVGVEPNRRVVILPANKVG